VQPQEGHCEKRCEIQGGGQETAVMIGRSSSSPEEEHITLHMLNVNGKIQHSARIFSYIVHSFYGKG